MVTIEGLTEWSEIGVRLGTGRIGKQWYAGYIYSINTPSQHSLSPLHHTFYPPTHSPNTSRERWHNHLDPTLKKSIPWTAEEEVLLFSQQRKIGNLWKEISHMIPGRSENDCKNKFNTTMR